MRRSQLRTALRTQYVFRCGYCGVSETQVGAELTIDHFQPLAQGGSDKAENWVYCCHACNEFKGDHWQPDSPRRILHPLRDNLADHLIEREDGVLEPLTETGAFHIDRLRLNRVGLVTQRCEHHLIGATLRIQGEILRRLEDLEREMQTLTDRVRRLEQQEEEPD